MVKAYPWVTERISEREEYDHLAPDGSKIYVLTAMSGASFAYCTLRSGDVSKAVAHKTVDECWNILGGRGEVWRRQGDLEETVPVEHGVCLTIPAGTSFQFRSLGPQPLTFLITTVPPWPGAEEARSVEGAWSQNGGSLA